MTSKYKSILHHLVYWGFIFYCLYVLILSLGFRIFSRDEMLEWFTGRFPDAYLLHEFGNQIFTPKHFAFIQNLTLVLIPALLILLMLTLIRKTTIFTFLDHLTTELRWLVSIHRDAFVKISQWERITVMGCLVLLLAIKVWLFAAIPFYVDEVFNFVYFAKLGFLHSTIYTNNHVAYNLATAVWDKLGISPELASRLTAVLSGIAVHVFLYSVIKHFFNFRTAIIVLLTTGTAFWFEVFSVLGISYMPLTFCVLMSAVAVVRMFNANGHGYALFIASCTGGFFLSKLFIIPMITLSMLWVVIAMYQRSWKACKLFLKSILLIALLSSLLYLPMFLWSGSGSLFTSYIGKDNIIKDLPALFENFAAITEVNTKSYVVIVVIALFSTFAFRRASQELKFLIALSGLSIAAMLLFILVLRVYPPSRTIIYMNVLLYTLIGAGLAALLKNFRFNGFFQLTIVLTFLTLKIWGSFSVFSYGPQQYYGSFQDTAFYNRLHETSACLIDTAPSLIYSDHQDSYLDFYLRLESERMDIPVTFTYDSDNLPKADIVVFQGRASHIETHFLHLPSDEFGNIFIRESLKESKNCTSTH